MPKDKQGNQLTWKEYMSRWKEGINGITGFQQVSMQLNSMWIILIGMICGIVISIINIKTLWWLLIVLIGGTFNTLVQMLGIYQKKIILERLEEDYVNLEDIKDGD